MSWIWWVYLAIAAVAVVGLVGYAVWLWHKASDLFSEIKMLGKRGEEFATLLEQVKTPDEYLAARQAGK